MTVLTYHRTFIRVAYCCAETHAYCELRKSGKATYEYLLRAYTMRRFSQARNQGEELPASSVVTRLST
jgi:hypothetical protein